MDLTQKVVLLTGASKGIGAACINAFESRGALLSLASRSVVTHPGALSTVADLTVQADREALISQTLKHYGRIDILVNNAGCGVYGPTADADPVAVDHLFALNFFAPLALIRLVLPHMRARGSGAIVNISSIAAEIPLPWMTLYSASKAALSSLSNGLRRELADTAILVTDVLPGYVTTEFQAAATGQPPPGVLAGRRRAITPQQCAESIARGIERGARTVAAPPSGWLAIFAQRLAPSLVDSPLQKMNR